MNNDQIRQFSLALLKADTEDEVVGILKRAGLWEDRTLWRLYGDKEGNWSAAGNQQAMGEAALVEKIVNCCDSRLMCECLLRGIDPESAAAPNSVRDAVAMFFESGKRSTTDEAGSLAIWAKAKRTEHSRFITVAATGGKPTRGQKRQNMCITIADQAEGQSPNRLPKTILSLNEKNKQRIRFVQGKWNMGGTGALRFCGRLGLQLVISRRHPDLAKKERVTDPSATQWSVTVVRRELPTKQSGEPVHSEFTYLAPLEAKEKPRNGKVLQFDAETLPLMAEQDEAYKREVSWGTAIKLYEYSTQVGQSNVNFPDGLMYALERLLPEIALPIRIHECRSGYKGEKDRSFETPISGLVVRLEDGKGGNLESDKFPLTVRLNVEGMSMSARIYAFKEKSAATYLRDEGVIFAINGQSHGSLPKSIFSRPKAVGLPRLKDSLLVLVDCSSLDARQREDLFMSSRDRLSKNAIRYAVEKEIEQVLKNDPELRRLQQERREVDVSSALSEEKPLETVLSRIFSSSPALKSLFLRGQRLSRPFAAPTGGKQSGGAGSTHPSGNTASDGGGGAGSTPVDGSGASTPTDDGDGRFPAKEEFKGRRHPTFFRIPNSRAGETYKRNCEEGRRCRIDFETDAENGYFDRATDKGQFVLDVVESTREIPTPTYSLTLDEGTAHLNLALPEEMGINDQMVLQASVTDPTLPDPMVNLIRLTVSEHHERQSGPPRTKKPKHGGADGGSGTGGETGGNESPSQGIKFPRVVEVYENDDNWQKYKFDASDACHVISDPIEVEGRTKLDHIFYINFDNASLKTEMKYAKQDVRILQAKFRFGNVLFGLAMLHQAEESGELEPRENSNIARQADDENQMTVQEMIRKMSAGVAPVLIPMIDQLSGISEEQMEEQSAAGEDV